MKKRRRFRRFGRAKQGVAAIEFAILAPMMVFLLFGSVDLLDLLDTNRRVENAAASLADVVARDTEVSNDEIAGLWAALDVLMFPDDGTGVNVRLTSISIEDATTARVMWSEGHGLAARTANSTIPLPNDMMVVGTSIILAEAEFEYGAPLGFLLDGPMTLGQDVYRRSRLVDPIPRVA